MTKLNNNLSIGANIATILTAIAAILTLYFGYNHYTETSAAQKEASAVNLYLNRT